MKIIRTKRREFVKTMSVVGAGAAFLPLGKALGAAHTTIPKRKLGKTGEEVSILGLGGFHIGLKEVEEEAAIRIIREAIDAGVNFLDNAWTYQEGRSELRMGKAIKDGYREKVLIMTKLMARDLEEAKKQFEVALGRFDVEMIDLMQFHAIGYKDSDVDDIYRTGMIQWAEDLRSQGLIRFIGFTGHSDPLALKEMIERGYDWDTIQMPLNLGDYHRNVSFTKDVLPLALEKEIAVLAMKTNGGGKLAESGYATPAEGLRYAMSLPVATAISGIDTMDILKENLSVAKSFRQMSEAEVEDFLSRGKGNSDRLEGYRRIFYDENKKPVKS